MGMTVKHNNVEYSVVELGKHVIEATKISVPVTALKYTDATETIFVKGHSTPVVVADSDKDKFVVLVKPSQDLVADKEGKVKVALFSKMLLKKIRNIPLLVSSTSPAFNPPRFYERPDNRSRNNGSGGYQRDYGINDSREFDRR